MLQDMLGLPERSIHITDVGAAFFGEAPPYQTLIDVGLGKLSAFEPDAREVGALRQQLGDTATILPYALGDGQEHTLYVCPKGLGMTSLLEPDPSTLGYFNLFPSWGAVVATERCW